MLIKDIKLYFRTMGLVGLYRLLRYRLTGVQTLLRVTKPTIPHPFYLRAGSSDVPTCKQVFYNFEYDFDVVKPPGVIVDAGANIGLAAIWFASRYPDATILAIEPEQSNFELLCRNVAPYANITPVHAALWNRNEAINLVDPGLGNWGFMTEGQQPAQAPPGNVAHRVQALTVDRILDDHGLARIDILKIDIEGAEKEVFADTSAWLQRVDAIIIELHDHMKPGCNRSFYNGSNGFDVEWKQGENVYVSRANTLRGPSL